MRKRYRWNPETCRQEPIDEVAADGSRLIIMPDIDDFVSPIDGQVVHGRRSLREHNKRHNVTNAADFTETWKKAGEERAKFYSGQPYDTKRRRQALKEAWDKLEQRSRK